LVFKDYVLNRKIHFKYVFSIFDCDKKRDDFAQPWDITDAKIVIENYKTMNKKIEDLYKKMNSI
jgi:hypothetical protein